MSDPLQLFRTLVPNVDLVRHADALKAIDAAYERGKREGRVAALTPLVKMGVSETIYELRRRIAESLSEAESERKSVARGSGERL